MTLLVVTPDYASHALPLLTLAGAWQRRGERVVVATGPAMAPLVRTAGMEHTELIMSRGSNAGVIRTREARDAEARSMEAFFESTRRGMLETLRFQAEARSTDLLWNPSQVAHRVMRIVDVHAPDRIIIDHLAFGASIGLRALEVPYGDVVLGHPTALPVGDETYGVPSAWPAALRPDRIELASLEATARGVSEAFTFAYNETLQAVAPGIAPVEDAFKAHGDVVLYNYPSHLVGPERKVLMPRHAFLGSAVRRDMPDEEVAAWLADDERPLVVVSFGTFLSARLDVLRTVAAALRRLDVRVAMAIGPNQRSDFDDLPSEWLVRSTIPQVTLLDHASLLITHAGNNSVTEALESGVPMLAMPFSTDQFDGAAAIERNIVGLALDPNSAPRPLIAGSARGLIEKPPAEAGRIGRLLRREPGPDLAYAAMAGFESLNDVEARKSVVPPPLSLVPS